MSKQIGLLLVRDKVISRDQMEAAQKLAEAKGSSLLLSLLESGALDERMLAILVNEKLHIPMAEPQRFERIGDRTIRLLPKDLADEFSAVPITSDQRSLRVAFTDPTQATWVDELRFFTRKDVQPMVAVRSQIEDALERYYGIKRQRPAKAASNVPLPTIPAAPPVQEIPGRLRSPAPAPNVLPDLPEEPLRNLAEPAARQVSAMPPAAASGSIGSPFRTGSDLPTIHQETLQAIDRAPNKEAIAEAFLTFATQVVRRAALFSIKKDVLLGWEGKGEQIQSRSVKGIMIPLNSPSLFQRVRDTRVYFLGEVPATTVDQIFLTALGGFVPPQVLVIPLAIREKVFGIFYADHGNDPLPNENLHYLHLLVAKVESAFENLILKAKRK